MNQTYYCGKNPEKICEAASVGALDLPCKTCNIEPEKKETNTEKIFIVVVNCYYLRDTQILCPNGKSIPDDTESDEFYDMYTDDDNWNNFRQDAYLGYYTWPAEDVERLKCYVAKNRGLDLMTLEAFPVETK